MRGGKSLVRCDKFLLGYVPSELWKQAGAVTRGQWAPGPWGDRPELAGAGLLTVPPTRLKRPHFCFTGEMMNIQLKPLAICEEDLCP